ncbi:MAG: hypothetical protein JKY54_10655, partial [Flavobacteriales bacterium]|nr:hypothetical protein [Flavobacteriales bacterium]
MDKLWQNTESKYLIIGGGPSGLSCAKNFIDYQIPFYAVEASDDLGGVWDIKNKRSAIYNSAHIISSKKKTHFDDFPMNGPADYPDYKAMKSYLDDYTNYFEIRSHYKLDCEVQ